MTHNGHYDVTQTLFILCCLQLPITSIVHNRMVDKVRKRFRSDDELILDCPSRFRLFTLFTVTMILRRVPLVLLIGGVHAQDIIYTKPSNQGLGLKLPTGYEQYRKAKRDFLHNSLQRNNIGNNKNSQRQQRHSSRQEQLLYRFRETLRVPPIRLILRGLEGVARAAFETNELALQGTSWGSSRGHEPVSAPLLTEKGATINSGLPSSTTTEKDIGHTRENTSPIQGFKGSLPPNSQRISNDDELLDPFTKDGARLLSASFRVLSNSVGLTADVIRISGETFAGAFGSSVKIIGSSFFSAAGTLDRLASIVSHDGDSLGDTNMDPGSDNSPRSRKPLTSEKLFERSVLLNGISSRYQPSRKDTQPYKKLGLIDNTRKVAGKSMRLVSSVVRGIGKSIVVAGAASESLTASTASVAEDTVRIVEEFAKSIADAFHVDETMEKVSNPPFSAPKDDKWETVDDWRHIPPSSINSKSSFVFYGTDDEEGSHLDLDSDLPSFLSSPTVKELLSAGDSVYSTLFHFIREKALMEFHFATEATEGIPALAPDLLGVLFICFISSVILLRQKRQHKGPHDHAKQATATTIGNQSDGVPFQKRMTIFTKRTETTGHHQEDHFIYVCTNALFRLIKFSFLLPIRILSVIQKVVMNRYVLLFTIHFLGGWLLCNSSQSRSLEIQRKSEVLGYRSAIESLTSSPHGDISLNESATWLNIILAKLWRVPLLGREPYTEHPYFIKRTIPTTNNGHFLYDGLEPYVSSLIGSILKESWETPEQMPTEIAYVSLHSFTLGSHAPIIRGIEIQKIDDDFNSVHLRVASDLLLSDSSLLFDFRISSLDYALLPVTQIKISSIDVRLDLDVRLELMSRYPFISMAKVSIARLPIVSVQIVPLNEDSGLRGINLSSLPVISDWVQSTIRRCLLDYLWPHYIAFDIERYLSQSNCNIV